ncbi:MAG: sortase [Bacilli bacterium]|nr:sortase [Bacilli bacterium]
MLGGFFISYNYIESKKVLAYDYVSTEFFSKNEETKQIITESEDTKIREAVTGEESDVVTNDFIGYLTIPKINLRKGFLDRRSTENDVEKNIYVVEGSTYPDVKRGNLIIAGHSGTGWKAFFNDLYKLGKGDYAIVSYKGKKYTYSITSIYKQSKTGKIAIYRNYDKTTLTLITCTNYDSKTQTVYVAELISTENE